MRTKTEPFEVLIPTPDGKQVAERVPIEVIHEWDEEIGEWLLSPESLRLIDDTKARHMGLLLPEELKALRERLGMTQSEIADLLEIGEKSWSRWESGRHRPSRSMNLFLRALSEGRLDPVFLNRISKRQPKWNPNHGPRIGHSYGKQAMQTSGRQHSRGAQEYSNRETLAADRQEAIAA